MSYIAKVYQFLILWSVGHFPTLKTKVSDIFQPSKLSVGQMQFDQLTTLCFRQNTVPHYFKTLAFFKLVILYFLGFDIRKYVKLWELPKKEGEMKGFHEVVL